MDILACADKNYMMPCGVMMRSVCENNSNEHIVFHLIIDDSVDENCKNKLQQCLVGDSTIHFYHFDNSILKKICYRSRTSFNYRHLLSLIHL